MKRRPAPARRRTGRVRAKAPGDSPALQAWRTGTDTLLEPLRPEIVTRPYAQHPSVSIAVRRIATNQAGIEIEVWPKGADRKTDKRIENHWFPELLSSPGEGLDGDQLREAIAIYLELRGEAFLWDQEVGRRGAENPRRPFSLTLIDGAEMMPRRDRNNEIVSWQWSSGLGSKTIPIEELTFLKQFNPYDPERGLGTLRAALVEYTGDMAAAVFNRSFIQRSAIPPLIFTTEKKWPDEDRKAYVDEWHATFGRPSVQGRAAALPDGVQAQILKVTQQEMEFLAGRRFSREQILGIFGVPPALAGVFEYANYANSREQLKFFWLMTMLPKVRYLQAMFTRLLQRYEPENVVWFKIEPVLAEINATDFKEKVQVAKDLCGLGWSPASVNEAIGLGLPTSGQPWLDMGWLPYSLVPAKDAMNPPEPADGEGDGTTPPPAKTAPPSALERLETAVARAAEDEPDPDNPFQRADSWKPKGTWTKADDRTAQWTGIAAKYGDLGRAYHRKIRTWEWELRSICLNNLRAQDGKAVSDTLQEEIEQAEAIQRALEGQDGVDEQTSLRVKTFLASLSVSKELIEDVEPTRRMMRVAALEAVWAQEEGIGLVSRDASDQYLWDSDDAQVKLKKISRPTWMRSMERGADVLRGQTGAKITFDILDPAVKAFLSAKDIKIVRIEKRIKEAVRQELLIGIGKGESTRDLAARVREVFDVERSRSLAIARTEVAQSFNAGQFEAKKQSGITKHEWLASKDGKVRESHEEIDGEVVAVGDTFSNGLRYAGDPDGPPEEVINCRCANPAVIGGDDE